MPRCLLFASGVCDCHQDVTAAGYRWPETRPELHNNAPPEVPRVWHYSGVLDSGGSGGIAVGGSRPRLSVSAPASVTPPNTGCRTVLSQETRTQRPELGGPWGPSHELRAPDSEKREARIRSPELRGSKPEAPVLSPDPRVPSLESKVLSPVSRIPSPES